MNGISANNSDVRTEATFSLTQRLRMGDFSNPGPLFHEAADALEAKDAEIERARELVKVWRNRSSRFSTRNMLPFDHALAELQTACADELEKALNG